jgi:hypothetical protein
MTSELSAPAVKPGFSDRTLTLNLTLKSAGGISLRSCEVIGRGFRHRTSFQQVSAIEDILVERLAQAIRASFANLPDGTRVLALPEFLVELPGLALSGAHVMIMEIKDGLRNAIFRFKEFLGSVDNAFQEEMGFHEPYANHAEKLAINVLADICLPLLNLSRQLDFASAGLRAGIPFELRDRVQEFEFQTELLKRFIFNAGLGHERASQAYLQTGPAVFSLDCQDQALRQ